MSRVAAVLLTFCLTACGMKGPLELPAGPVPEPLFGNPKPAKPAADKAGKGGADVSTDTQTNAPNPQ